MLNHESVHHEQSHARAGGKILSMMSAMDLLIQASLLNTDRFAPLGPIKAFIPELPRNWLGCLPGTKVKDEDVLLPVSQPGQ